MSRIPKYRCCIISVILGVLFSFSVNAQKRVVDSTSVYKQVQENSLLHVYLRVIDDITETYLQVNTVSVDGKKVDVQADSTGVFELLLRENQLIGINDFEHDSQTIVLTKELADKNTVLVFRLKRNDMYWQIRSSKVVCDDLGLKPKNEVYAGSTVMLKFLFWNNR